MIKNVVLVSLITCSFLVLGQEKRVSEKKIPKEIKSYLDENFKDNEKLKAYEITHKDTIFFEIDLEYKEQNYSLVFSPDGKLLEEEIELKFEELPLNIQDKLDSYLKEKYPKHKVLECQEVNPKLESKVYEIRIKVSGDYFEVYFDKNGNFTEYEELVFKPIITAF